MPDELNMQDIDEDDDAALVSETEFVDWLNEGRHDCEVARLLLNSWFQDNVHRKCNETLQDFFTGLLEEYKSADPGPAYAGDVFGKRRVLPLSFLSQFVCTNCTLTFPVPSGSETFHDEVLMQIRREMSAV